MNAALGRLVTQSMGRGKGRITIKALSDQTGLTESWIKQVRGGNIEQPGRDKLELLATGLNIELPRLLALTDQLGAAAHTAGTGDTTPVPAAYLARVDDLVKVVNDLVGLVEKLLRDDERSDQVLVGAVAKAVALAVQTTLREAGVVDGPPRS